MYDFADRNRIAREGALDIEHWLRTKPETCAVQNVENDEVFRSRDIDLLWHVSGRQEPIRLEVKVDTYDGTGNLFLETHSNVEAGTPGCFLYTDADYILYYFIGPRRLIVLPVLSTRQWFDRHEKDLMERDTTTTVPNRGFYTTRGRLAPVRRILAEVPGVLERVLDSRTG